VITIQHNGTTYFCETPADAEAAGVPAAVVLDALRADAKARIDQAAGRARARYITTAPGQEAVYLLKERQAREFAAAGYPKASVPPLIQADVDAGAGTAQAAADAIIAQADAWIALAARIEQARRAGKAAVDAATDSAAIDAAVDAAITQLNAI